MNIIEFQNVTVREQGKIILKDISFAISRGEKAVLYGKSGSGKSTILRALLGGYSFFEGSIRVDGLVLDRNSVNLIRKKIAYIGQEPVLGLGTVKEVMMLPFNFKANTSIKPDSSKLVELLQRVGLPGSLLDADASTVSGGEKQRIAVVRALLLQKKIFCIDEATSALDSDSAQIIVSLFKDEDCSILSVSHDRRWFVIAQRFLKIDKGEIIQDTRTRSEIEI